MTVCSHTVLHGVSLHKHQSKAVQLQQQTFTELTSINGEATDLYLKTNDFDSRPDDANSAHCRLFPSTIGETKT